MILFKFHTALLATLVLISCFHENNALLSPTQKLDLQLKWKWLKQNIGLERKPEVYTPPTIDDMVKTWKSLLALVGYASSLSTDELKTIILSESPAPVGASKAPQGKPKGKPKENPEPKGGCLPKLGSCAKNEKQKAKSETKVNEKEENLKIIMQAFLDKEKEAFKERSNRESSENMATEENQGPLKSLFYYCARTNKLVGEKRDELYGFSTPSNEYPFTAEQKCTLACMLRETGLVDPETGRPLPDSDQFKFNNVMLLLETTGSFVGQLFPEYAGQNMKDHFLYKARTFADACRLEKVEGMDKCGVADKYYRTVRGKDYTAEFGTIQRVWAAARSESIKMIAKKEQEAKKKEEEEKKKEKEAKKKKEEEEANKNQ